MLWHESQNLENRRKTLKFNVSRFPGDCSDLILSLLCPFHTLVRKPLVDLSGAGQWGVKATNAMPPG